MLMPCQAGRRWFRPDFPLCIRTRGGRHLTSAHSPRYAVIGGGLAGVAVAWHLLQASSPTKPLSLDLIVQGEGLADGASGAAAGLLHPTSPRGKLMWRGDEAFLATRRLVDVAEAAGRKQIAWRQGVLRLAQTQRQDEQLRAAAETMPSARYVPASHLDAILAGLTEEASAGLGALLFSDGMALDTKGYLDGLWADTQRRARELGTEAVLHENTTVHDLAELNAGKGPYAGIVLAMGAGVADLAGVKDHLPPFMDMVAGISLTLELGAEGSAGAVHPERVHGAEPPTATTAVEPDAHSPDARCAGDLPAHASGWPEGAPSLAAMPYIAAQGSRRCVIGATWDRPAAPDQNPGTAPRTAGELLSQARALWPGLAAWRVAHRAHGTRVVSQRTDHGTPPYGGRLALGPAPALPPVWLMSGLGARGLLYHAWLAQLTAEGVLRGGEEHLPPELLRWRRRGG
ncbi:CPLD32 [Auxenochlorella protothecoides x Auxenochlorella symbiontica]